jgi:nucleoredoxin
MPWLALDYKERKKREDLFRKFNVNDIPKLVLIDGDSGEIICTNAKEQILYFDVDGVNFPWKS